MTERMLKRFGLLAIVAAAATGASCGDVVRQGRSPAYLIIDQMTASPGSAPDDAGDELSSDVSTGGTVFEDLGTANFLLALKDLGQGDSPTQPTTTNFVTITRYHVSYRRTDGRNTPGVDVPFAFDGAGTLTVGDKPAALTFVLVRAQAKLESPLKNLRGAGGAVAISTIADVTFYGRDQAGNDVAVSGSISVNFADWADPASAG